MSQSFGLSWTIIDALSDLSGFAPVALAALIGLWASLVFRSHPFSIIVDALIGTLGGTALFLAMVPVLDADQIGPGTLLLRMAYSMAFAAVGSLVLLGSARFIAARRKR